MNPTEVEPRSPPGTLRLFAPALGCWALIAWAITEPGAAAIVTFSAAAAGVVLVVLMTVTRSSALRRMLGVLLIFSAAVLLVGVRAAVMEEARSFDPFAGAATSGASVDFDATLAGYPKSRVNSLGESRAWVRASAITDRQVSVPVLLWLGAPDAAHTRWAPGVAVAVRGKVEAQGAGEHAAYTVQVFEISEHTVQPFAARTGGVAADLRNGLRAAAAKVAGAELVPGFAVGDTSLVSETLENAMLATSLTHLTAVSGSNTGLIVAVAMWGCSWLGIGRRWRIVIAAGALIGFVVLVGPDASVQRAAVMAAVLLVSGFGGRRATALPSLGVAVLVLLSLDPWQALQPGFALSVAATAGILLLTPPISEWFRHRLRVPAWLALPFAVAISAQIACGPLLLLLEPGIPAVGVIANVIAAPAAPVGTGLGVLATLMIPLAPGLGHLLVVAASLFARWVAATALVTQQLPLARWHWPEGWPGAVLLAFCEITLIVAWAIHTSRLPLPRFGSRPKRKPWQKHSRSSNVFTFVVTLLVSIGLGAFIVVTAVAPLAQRFGTPQDWAVVACDVGQGDAVLLRDPTDRNEIVLVDTGDDPGLLQHCLDSFGVKRISLLVLTHDDKDHVGALSTVLLMTDAALISPTVLGERFEERDVVRQLVAANVPYATGKAGMGSNPKEGGVQWGVIGPVSGATVYESNAASVVMFAEAAGVTVLLLGDTGEEQQRELLHRYAGITVRVLKVAHHGSRDQSESLISAVGADFGLISAGHQNRYGHPAEQTLAMLQRAGTQALRTDELGSIAIIPGKGGALEVWVQGKR